MPVSYMSDVTCWPKTLDMKCSLSISLVSAGIDFITRSVCNIRNEVVSTPTSAEVIQRVLIFVA